MSKWNLNNIGTFVKSFRRKGCNDCVKPGLPADPNKGTVSYVAPHTRQAEKMGHEQDGIPDVMKDQVRY